MPNLLLARRRSEALREDPRTRPWAYLELDGKLLEVEEYAELRNFGLGDDIPSLLVTDAQDGRLRWLSECEVRRARLVRPAPSAHGLDRETCA